MLILNLILFKFYLNNPIYQKFQISSNHKNIENIQTWEYVNCYKIDRNFQIWDVVIFEKNWKNIFSKIISEIPEELKISEYKDKKIFILDKGEAKEDFIVSEENIICKIKK